MSTNTGLPKTVAEAFGVLTHKSSDGWLIPLVLTVDQGDFTTQAQAMVAVLEALDILGIQARSEVGHDALLSEQIEEEMRKHSFTNSWGLRLGKS